ncbi:MAG: alpha/beta hydrolase [Dehalococcoidia bacterium]|nr:alpha/beta hydrolase [Dehalococcoidia bacterium]
MASEQLNVVLDLLKQRGSAAGNGELDVTATRAGMDQMAAQAAPDITVEPAEVGGVPGEWVSAPGADPGSVVLYLHGGGYVLGSPTSHRDLAARLSRASGMRVFTADYRLAPEHPFPAAVDDAVAAYRALLKSGIPASRLAIAGDSAGGGLTLATVASLKATGDELPATALCISPWTDLALTGGSLKSRAAIDPIISGDAAITAMASLYLGSADPKHRLASPLYANYAGFPPLLIQVGTSEVLFDDAARTAARACEAGVPVCFEPWQDMIHVWHMFAPMLPEGQQAIERMGAWLRERIPQREAITA